MPESRTAREVSSREVKRRRIMLAAIQVFAKKGYFAARMSDVAKRAGVADGTLYLYFEGKEDLLISVFDDVLNRFSERVRQEIAGMDDPVEKLRVMVRLHLQTLGSDRALAHILQIETRHSRRFMNLFTRGRLGEYLNLIRDIIEEGQETGSFRRDVSPGLAINFVFGAVDELVTSWLLAEEPSDLVRSTAPLVALLCAGLAAPPDPVGGSR
jgi:TetR/AcrR family fatty acid metabolism transcriptional regulator